VSAPADALVFFGATGDLAFKKIFPSLQNMVRRGEEGLSTGRGFYDWSGCDKELVRKLASSRLANLLAFLEKETPPESSKPRPIAR